MLFGKLLLVAASILEANSKPDKQEVSYTVILPLTKLVSFL